MTAPFPSSRVTSRSRRLRSWGPAGASGPSSGAEVPPVWAMSSRRSHSLKTEVPGAASPSGVSGLTAGPSDGVSFSFASVLTAGTSGSVSLACVSVLTAGASGGVSLFCVSDPAAGTSGSVSLACVSVLTAGASGRIPLSSAPVPTTPRVSVSTRSRAAVFRILFLFFTAFQPFLQNADR